MFHSAKFFFGNEETHNWNKFSKTLLAIELLTLIVIDQKKICQMASCCSDSDIHFLGETFNDILT